MLGFFGYGSIARLDRAIAGEESSAVPESIERVTMILRAIRDGETGAVDRLYDVVYEELRHVASRRMAGEAVNHTLDATALVHESYLRLVGDNDRGFDNRLHFFSAAAESMRRILIDRARKKRRLKRGGDRQREVLNDEIAVTLPDDIDLLALDDALERLDAFDSRKAKVVKLRYFLGLTSAEAGELLGIVERTVESEWRLARAWLKRELSSDDSAGGTMGGTLS